MCNSYRYNWKIQFNALSLLTYYISIFLSLLKIVSLSLSLSALSRRIKRILFLMFQEMKVNWATSPGNQPKQDTSSEYASFQIFVFIRKIFLVPCVLPLIPYTCLTCWTRILIGPSRELL